MNGWMLVYVAITALAGVASAFIGYRVWERRHMPGAPFMVAMTAGAALACAACVGEILAGSLAAELIWARLAYIGVVTIPPSWLLFCLVYTGRLSPRSWNIVAIFSVIPVLTVLFVFLPPGPQMVWSSVAHSPAPGPTPLLVHHGAWFWVNVSYAYACLLTGSVLLLVTVFRQVRLLTSVGIILVVAVALPWVANVLGVLGLTPSEGLDLTPPALVASAALIVVGLTRLHALDVFPGLVPAARTAVMDDMRDGVLVLDMRSRVVDANRSAEHLLARPDRKLLGRPLREVLDDPAFPDPHDTGPVDLMGHGLIETAVTDRTGRRYHLEIAVSSLGDNAHAAGFVVVMRDITDRRALQDELRHRATHDELTDLPNRALLREHLDALLDPDRRSLGKVALLIIDLDHFKDVNDTFGHEAGDRLLSVVGQRLRHSVSEADLVARLGGDEFAVVLNDCGPADASVVAGRLRRQVLLPIDVLQQKVVVSSSIGIAVSPVHGVDVGTLMRHADVALYLAKDDQQGGVALYQPRRDPNSGARLELLNDLRTAIHDDRLVLHFQPQMDLRSGVVARVEALARWPQPGGKLMCAGDFIPLAEQNGLMPSITAWALESALRQRQAWSQAGWPVDVSVNLSALDLRDPGLADRIERTLAEAGVAPRHLWLEITETAVMRDPERARRTLVGLCEAGAHLAIDDFGVGQSSLAYVRSLPASDLKIDRSFVRDVVEQPRDAAIIKAVVALAHDLGMTVTAEGVEDAATLYRLKQLGCDHAQGYHLARPMPADQMLSWAQRPPAGSVHLRAVDAPEDAVDTPAHPVDAPKSAGDAALPA